LPYNIFSLQISFGSYYTYEEVGMGHANRRSTTPGRAAVSRAVDPSLGEDAFEKIVADLRALLAAEFQRGATNAASRIMRMVTANDIRDYRTLDRPTGRLKRAPRGASRSLIERVLVKGPMTIREIREAAETPAEKFLSYQTVRLELERGAKQKRYKKIKDKWVIA
jgi:hypothetical protein